jgi:hypothetical protein
MPSPPPLPPSPMTMLTMGVLRVAIVLRLKAMASAWAALLGSDAGVGAGGVDESDDGEAELLGLLHDPQGLAVALGIGLAEVPFDAGPGRPALLVPDDGRGPALVEGQPGDDRRVVGEPPVPVHLHEVLEEEGDVVQGVRAFGVAGDLDDVDGGHPGDDLGPFLLDLPPELGDAVLLVEVVALGDGVDLFLEGQDALFQGIELHGFFHAHVFQQVTVRAYSKGGARPSQEGLGDRPWSLR